MTYHDKVVYRHGLIVCQFDLCIYVFLESTGQFVMHFRPNDDKSIEELEQLADNINEKLFKVFNKIFSDDEQEVDDI